MGYDDYGPIPKGAKGPPGEDYSQSGGGRDSRDAPGGYIKDKKRGSNNDGPELGPDGYPVPPKGAKGPPAAEYGESGQGKGDREPPGGYLGEGKKGGKKNNYGGDDNEDDHNGGDDNHNNNNNGGHGKGKGKGHGKNHGENNNGGDDNNYGEGHGDKYPKYDPEEPDYSADVWEYIHYAASRADSSHGELARRIREARDINVRSTTTYYTPLHVAVKFGQVSGVRELLAAGADVNRKDILGQTPLSLACCYKIGTEIPRLLLDKRADTEAVDKYSWTPLFWATKKEYSYDLIQLLVDRGADRRHTDKRGKIPRDYAEGQRAYRITSP